MFKQRRQRFERLLRLRKREADQKQALLARQHEEMRTTRLALEDAQQRLRQAAETYRLPSGQQRSAEAFFEASAWLRDRVKFVEQAMVAQEQSKERVRLAGQALMEAEREKRKVETLLDRLKEEERHFEQRRDQIEQDEIASRLFSREHHLGH